MRTWSQVLPCYLCIGGEDRTLYLTIGVADLVSSVPVNYALRLAVLLPALPATASDMTSVPVPVCRCESQPGLKMYSSPAAFPVSLTVHPFPTRSLSCLSLGGTHWPAQTDSTWSLRKLPWRGRLVLFTGHLCRTLSSSSQPLL